MYKQVQNSNKIQITKFIFFEHKKTARINRADAYTQSPDGRVGNAILLTFSHFAKYK